MDIAPYLITCEVCFGRSPVFFPSFSFFSKGRQIQWRHVPALCALLTLNLDGMAALKLAVDGQIRMCSHWLRCHVAARKGRENKPRGNPAAR
jgi:hypothetical protein